MSGDIPWMDHTMVTSQMFCSRQLLWVAPTPGGYHHDDHDDHHINRYHTYRIQYSKKMENPMVSNGIQHPQYPHGDPRNSGVFSKSVAIHWLSPKGNPGDSSVMMFGHCPNRMVQQTTQTTHGGEQFTQFCNGSQISFISFKAQWTRSVQSCMRYKAC